MQGLSKDNMEVFIPLVLALSFFFHSDDLKQQNKDLQTQLAYAEYRNECLTTYASVLETEKGLDEYTECIDEDRFDKFHKLNSTEEE